MLYRCMNCDSVFTDEDIEIVTDFAYQYERVCPYCKEEIK